MFIKFLFFLKKILGNIFKNKINKNKIVNLKYYPRQRIIPSENITIIDTQKETNVLDVDLIDKSITEKDKKILRQYTKQLVTFLTIMGSVWVTWSYILATYVTIVLKEPYVVIELSKQVLITILGTVVVYGIKAFFETFFKKKNELLSSLSNQEDNKLNNLLIDSSSNIDEEETVG